MAKVTVRDENRRKAKLKKLDASVRRALLISGTLVQNTAVHNMQRVRPKTIATGQTIRSINVSPVRRNTNARGSYLFVRVGPRTKYAVYGIEFGRPAGKMPPLDAIKEWVVEKSLASASDPDEVERVAFLIARQIGQEGFPAQKIMNKSLRQKRKEIHKIISEHAQEALR